MCIRDSLSDHVFELSGIVSVAGMGVGDQWDATIDRDHEPQPDQAKIFSELRDAKKSILFVQKVNSPTFHQVKCFRWLR